MDMQNMQTSEVQQRLDFIDLTISHAARACCGDTSVPAELTNFVQQLGRQSFQARQALHSNDAGGIRQTIDNLAVLSELAQNIIRPSDGLNYDVKSAVILAHIEVAALRLRLN